MNRNDTDRIYTTDVIKNMNFEQLKTKVQEMQDSIIKIQRDMQNIIENLDIDM